MHLIARAQMDQKRADQAALGVDGGGTANALTAFP